MLVIQHLDLKLALIATGLVAGLGLALPEKAFAQSAGDNGFGGLDGSPHTCAIQNTGGRGIPVGDGNTYDLACGTNSRAGGGATGEDAANTAIGGGAHAAGICNTALGQYAHASGDFSEAMGSLSSASAESSVALGSFSKADRAQTVSVGDVGFERQIVHVGDGTQATDAVNLRQMEAGDADTLADANAYTDEREALIRDEMVAGDATALASANTHADAGDAATLTVANARADAGDARTLDAANRYTDQQVSRFETGMNGRFRNVEMRMDQVTAMSAAFAVMAGNNAGAGTRSANRLVVGVGNYSSETAMAVGYSRALTERAAFNAGVSFTGGEVTSGGSFGFAW